MGRPSSAFLGRSLRAFTFAASSLASSALVVGLAGRALSVSGVARSPMALDLAPQLEGVRSQMRAARSPERILVVGDSVLNPALPVSVPAAMEDELSRVLGTDPRPRVYPLSWPGWSILGEYCLADEMLRMNPTRIVLEVNLRGLAPPAVYGPGFPELAGYIRPYRFAEALRLPLPQAGIAANRLLFYRLIVEGGGLPLWTLLLDVQARLYNLREPVERAVEGALGVHSWEGRKVTVLLESMHRLLDPGKYRESREHAVSSLGNVARGIDASYPPLGTLRALLRRLVVAKKRPLVWIAPVNLEHLRGLGIDVGGFERSVSAIRDVVEGSGAAILDLHAALPDESFADSGDHPRSEGERPGTDVVGVRVARALLGPEIAPLGERPASPSLP